MKRDLLSLDDVTRPELEAVVAVGRTPQRLSQAWHTAPVFGRADARNDL